MAAINRPSKDIRLTHQLRLIANGKFPVQGLKVKHPMAMCLRSALNVLDTTHIVSPCK
nr:MAG TPA: hypothetical protein [Bacteriophage sp.]